MQIGCAKIKVRETGRVQTISQSVQQGSSKISKKQLIAFAIQSMNGIESFKKNNNKN